MSDTVCKYQTNIHRKNINTLNFRLSERFKNLSDRETRHHKIFNNLSEFEQKQLLKNFKSDYSLILFDYFASEDTIERKIEELAQQAFDISLPMNKIVEIHLDVIDILERQLLLEGLHIEYLSDFRFRLILINVIAHLGELYRNALNVKCLDIS